MIHDKSCIGVFKMAQGNGKKPFYKSVWLWVIVAIVVVFGAYALGTSSSSSDKSSEKSSSSASTSSKSNTEKVSLSSTNDPSDNEWSYKNDIFDAGNLTYKITKSAIMDSAAQNGSKTLVLYTDVTNNSSKNMDPSNIYMVVHAFQQNDTSRLQLNPGVVSLDENANNPLQAQEDALNNELLPGKTVQAAFTFDLQNTNDVVVEYSNADFKKIGSKTYQIQ